MAYYVIAGIAILVVALAAFQGNWERYHEANDVPTRIEEAPLLHEHVMEDSEYMYNDVQGNPFRDGGDPEQVDLGSSQYMVPWQQPRKVRDSPYGNYDPLLDYDMQDMLHPIDF